MPKKLGYFITDNFIEYSEQSFFMLKFSSSGHPSCQHRKSADVVKEEQISHWKKFGVDGGVDKQSKEF